MIIHIYELTATYPHEERYGIVSQMRRAVISIGNNISEGSSRKSLKDQARFCQIAYGSALELLSDTIASYDLDFVTEEQLIKTRCQIDKVTAMLDGLYKSQLARQNVK